MLVIDESLSWDSSEGKEARNYFVRLPCEFPIILFSDRYYTLFYNWSSSYGTFLSLDSTGAEGMAMLDDHVKVWRHMRAGLVRKRPEWGKRSVIEMLVPYLKFCHYVIPGQWTDDCRECRWSESRDTRGFWTGLRSRCAVRLPQPTVHHPPGHCNHWWRPGSP